MDSTEFKVGQKVYTIEGEYGIVDHILEGTLCYPLMIWRPHLDCLRGFTLLGKIDAGDMFPSIYPYPVELVRKKVPHYRVLFRDNLSGDLQISSNYYKSTEDFKDNKILRRTTPIALLDMPGAPVEYR